MWYTLDEENRPVPCDNPVTAAAWIGHRVDHTQINDKVYVSTVFLSLDHGWGNGPPTLFETMIFGFDEELMWRYCSWDDALVGHDVAVKRALKLLENESCNRHRM